MSAPHVLAEIKDGIGWLTLNRPDRLNSFTLDMHEALRAALASEAYRRDYARESLIPVMMGRAEARAFTQRFVGEVTATLRELGVIR